MNKLSVDKKVAVISALVEGCSVRSTVRMTGVAKGTILRLLAEVGTACEEFHNTTVRNIPAKRVQIDEIWSFVGAKQKNVTEKMAAARICGDVWTFTAIEAQRSSLSVGRLEGETRGSRPSFFRMSPSVCRTEFNSQPMDTRCT